MPTLSGLDYELVQSTPESNTGFTLKGLPYEVIEGNVEPVGAVRTAASNLVRGATQSFTQPVEYVGALTGLDFIGDTAKRVDEFVKDYTPVNPEYSENWLATYIPQGIGQVGAMLVPSAAFFKVAQGFKTGAAAAQAAGNLAEATTLISKANAVEKAGHVAMIGLMGGMEGNDAYQRAIEQGDDQATAVAKSLGYATVAAAIENKWGTGMLIKRMEGILGPELAAKELAKQGVTRSEKGELLINLAKKTGKDLATGFAEEASQRLAQDIIVSGEPDVKGILTEGGVGGIVQGLVGLPMNVFERSATPEQKSAMKRADALLKNNAPETAKVVLENSLSQELTPRDIGILEPSEQTTEAQPVVAPTEAGKTQIATEQTATPAAPTISTQTQTTEVSNALPIQEPNAGLLRSQGQELGLPQVGQGNQVNEVVAGTQTPSSSTQEQVAPAPIAEKPVTPQATTFTKGQRVVSTRYGEGEVLRMIGKRVQVQFDDGSKFAVTQQELAPKQEPVVQSETVQSGAAQFVGIQEGFENIPSIELWNIPNESGGMTTVSRETAIAKGFQLPPPVESSVSQPTAKESSVVQPETSGLTSEEKAAVQKELQAELSGELTAEEKAVVQTELQQENQPDKFEQLLNKAIEATKFDPTKLQEGITGAPVWMTKAVLNGALRVIRAAYRGGKAFTESVQSGIEWIKSQNIKGFNEEEARNFINQNIEPEGSMNIKPTAQAVDVAKEAYQGMAANDIQPDVGTQLRTYRAIYNIAKTEIEGGMKTAPEFIQAHSATFGGNLNETMAKAFNDALNSNPLPATLNELPPSIVAELKDASTKVEPTVRAEPAKTKVSTAGKNILETEWAQRNPELAKVLREGTYNSTTDAKRIAVSKALVDFFADDLEAAYNYAVNPPAMSGVSPDLQQSMLSYLVIKAERSNNMQLAANSLRFMKQQRSTMGQYFQGIQTAEKLMVDEGSPTVWQMRAQSDFADDQRDVIEPVIRASEVKAQIAEAKNKAVDEIQPDIEKLAKKFFPKGMREMGIIMRQLLQQHAGVQESTRKALFDLIASREEFQNLSASDKLRLANELQTLWENARNKELQKIFQREAQMGGKDVLAKRNIMDKTLPRLIKLINTGSITDESIYNAIAPEFDLPVFDEKIAAEIYRRAQLMQQTPEGLPKNQRYIDLLNYIASQRKLSSWEILKSYWYASILSGTGTQVTNGVAAAINVQLQNLLLAATSPATAGKIFLGAIRGYGVGFSEASAIMGRGDFSNRITNEIMQESGTLEFIKKEDATWKKALSNFKYVSRLMAFVDTMNAMSAVEARAYHMANQMAIGMYRDGKITHDQISEKAFELLQVRPQDIAKWQGKATAEAEQGIIAKSDIARRTQDLIKRNRPPEIMEESLNFGRIATFNNKPTGFVGNIANSIIYSRKKVWPLQIIFPFVQTPANVLNELLNYTPIGIWRAVKQNPLVRLKAKQVFGVDVSVNELSPTDTQILRAKATFGFMAFAGMALLAAHYDDDKDPPFDISGGWYGVDPNKEKQLLAEGKRKWSIKVGNVWIDYRQTPVAIMLGTIGNYRDTKKYAGEKQRGLNASSIVYHGMSGAFVITDMSFLASFTSLFQTFNPQNSAQVEKRVYKLFASTAGGFSPAIAKEIDTYFNPTIQQPDTFLQYMQAQLPIARSYIGKPMINVLGQPVKDAKTAADRFYELQTNDPVWKELSRLAEQGVFVPVPSSTAKTVQNGKRVKMTDEQVYEYRKKAGEFYYQKLQQDLPRLRQMNAEQASKYFDSEFAPLRERARNLMR